MKNNRDKMAELMFVLMVGAVTVMNADKGVEDETSAELKLLMMDVEDDLNK